MESSLVAESKQAAGLSVSRKCAIFVLLQLCAATAVPSQSLLLLQPTLPNLAGKGLNNLVDVGETNKKGSPFVTNNTYKEGLCSA